MAGDEKPLYSEIVKALQKRATDLTDGLAKRLGPVGEKVAPEEQMAAWKEITPEDFLVLTERHGTENILRWAIEMSRRERISNAEKLAR